MEAGFDEKDITDLVEQESRDMHLNGMVFYLSEEIAGFREEVFTAPFEPFDQDRGINDDLFGHTGYPGSIG